MLSAEKQIFKFDKGKIVEDALFCADKISSRLLDDNVLSNFVITNFNNSKEITDYNKELLSKVIENRNSAFSISNRIEAE